MKFIILKSKVGSLSSVDMLEGLKVKKGSGVFSIHPARSGIEDKED